MRDEQHAGAVLLDQMHERVPEEALRCGVDARDRFVEHQQRRLAREGARDERALLLPTGELVHRPAGEGRRGRPTRSRARPGLDRCATSGSHHRPSVSRPAATISRTVAGSSELRLGRWGTYPRRPRRRTVRGGRPNRRTVPESGLQRAEQQMQQRRLARSVRADQGDELARTDRQIDVVEHRFATVSERSGRLAPISSDAVSRPAAASSTAEAIAQHLQVLTHHRQVGLAAGDLFLGQALERAQDRGRDPRLRGERLGDLG